MKSVEEIEAQIVNAFSNVKKGDGIGLREAIAMDKKAEEEELQEARKADYEDDWRDLREERDGDFGIALSYTDILGFRFILPAAILSALKGSRLNKEAVIHNLVFSKFPYEDQPNFGNKEYVSYLKSIKALDTANYFNFTGTQKEAISNFLQWAILGRGREGELELRQKSHENMLQFGDTDYNLDSSDISEIFKEEQRIVNEWSSLPNL